MTNEVKTGIINAANSYMVAKGLTAAKFAVLCDVNKSYISYMLNGQLTYESAGTTVQIPDKYFGQVASAIKHRYEKSYWPDDVETREYVELMAMMTEAKLEHVMKMLFVYSGAGKTYSYESFVARNPLYTYGITMHSELTVNDMFNELVKQLDIPNKGSKGWKRTQCIIKMRDIRRAGGNPMVVIDEGENMNTRMRATIKGFYDGIVGYASIVVLGTPKLKEIMKAAKDTDADAGPQTYRRFRAGFSDIRPLQDKHKRFEPFYTRLEDMGFVIEQGLRNLLVELCDNYGELRDFLEPALRKADKMNKICDEAFFRLMYNMPLRKVA